MTIPAQDVIQAFLHEQVACWNRGDKEGFFNCYRAIAPTRLEIEYVGKHTGDGWPILEGMWENNQAKIEIEEVAMVINGCEAACHNRNNIKGTDSAIETIEIYRFGNDGDVYVRYFIDAPG